MLDWAPLLMAHEENPTDVPQVRRTLAALVHRVELDPETRAIRALPHRSQRAAAQGKKAGGLKVASPQRTTLCPTIAHRGLVRLPGADGCRVTSRPPCRSRPST